VLSAVNDAAGAASGSLARSRPSLLAMLGKRLAGALLAEQRNDGGAEFIPGSNLVPDVWNEVSKGCQQKTR
jgi:hypothetical protein